MQRLRLAVERRPLLISAGAAALSGVLLWLSLPPADLGPLAFVALVPLLWAIRAARPRRGALLGLVFGVAFYAVLLSWLIPLTVLGWGVLVLGVAAWLALFGAYTAAVWREAAPVRTALAVGAGWAVVDWLRTLWPFEGWSWVGLGYTQHDNPLMIPLASVVGALGTGFVMAAINALVLSALSRAGAWRRATAIAAAAVLAVAPGLIPAPATDGPPVEVAIVQGNVPEDIATASRIIEDHIVAENHAALNLQLAGDPPDLVVWPENALDLDPTRDRVVGPLVEDSIRAVGAHHLIGAITEAEDGRLLNEDLLYGPDARLLDRYAKNHLLPFGEYVPFRPYLEGWVPDIEQVRADLSPGTEPGRFEISGSRFAAIICFENAFPDLVRDYVTPDSGFLVISTNNATFGRSPAPAQHVVLSELRAVESGRWAVHAALTGISAIISPSGEITARTDLFERAVVRGRFPTASGTTVYDAIGGWLPFVFLAGMAVAYLAPRRPRRRELAPLPEDARAAVIVPTYNERDTIEEVIDRVLASADRLDVKVVDDSSPDGTGDVVRKIAERQPRLSLVERPEKGGLASAYVDGFVLAIDAGYDLVVEMDADLSHRPEELPRLLEGARSHHVAIGSRYVPGGQIRNWSVVRRALSRAGNLYVRALLGLPVADATSGFRAYRAEALRELITHQLRSEGYAFQIELAYRAWRRGMAVGEVPIRFEERRHGHSKISRAIVFEALWHVFLWAVRDRLFRRSAPTPKP